MFIITLVSIYILVVTAAAIGVFRWQKKRGTGRALLAGALTVLLLSLFYPIPIHAGFSFFFEILLHELKDQRIHVELAVKDERKNAFHAKLAERFSGPLPMPAMEQAGGAWRSFPRQDNTRGWYDPGTGLAWTDILPLYGENVPGLDRVRAFCAAQDPKGFWALPTEAELSLFWKAGGYEVSPLNDHGLVGLLEDANLQTELLTLRKGRNGSYAVRCVALGPGAPLSGYSQKDISLTDWNTYQLGKMKPGSLG